MAHLFHLVWFTYLLGEPRSWLKQIPSIINWRLFHKKQEKKKELILALRTEEFLNHIIVVILDFQLAFAEDNLILIYKDMY